MAYLQLKKAAVLLGLSEAEIRDLVKAGELEAIHFGPRALRISEESLMEFLKKSNEKAVTS